MHPSSNSIARLDADRVGALLRERGLTDAESALWLRLFQRTEFANAWLTGPGGAPWECRPYQRGSFESYAPRKVHCDGRDVGKTTEIELMAAWASVARPNTEMLIATQCENHLYPLMDRVIQRIEGTPALAGGLAEIRRTPSWRLRFANGFVLWGRIAGPRGVNFQGLHVDWQVVDEAQEMTETAWGELYQALNGGGWRWVYGVPNGLRNTFYRMTRLGGAEQYNWPSTLHPDYTPEKDAELALLYGGRASQGYIHRVLGQHGAPQHAVFHLEDYLACVRDGLEFHDITLREGDPFSLPAPMPRGCYYLGCDLGYARDPSEFVVYRAEGPDLVNVLRFHLEGVNYAAQQEVLAELDRACGFARIAIDAGNNGRAVAHALMARDPGLCARVEAIDFGGAVTLEPLPDGRPDRRPAKQFMTELLQRHMTDRTLVFPRLPERESQYAAHTYHTGLAGRIVYEKGDDHIIDADRCAILAHYLDTHQDGAPPESMVIVRGW